MLERLVWVTADEIARTLSDHGLAALLVGSFLEGEAVLLAAGVLSARGLLRPVNVWLVASLGAWAGHLVWFSLARLATRSGPASRRRWMSPGGRLARVDDLVRSHPTASIVALQYLYGARLIGAFALGLTGLSWRRFAVTEVPNCLLWSALFTAMGYAAGDVSTRIFAGWLRWAWVAISLGVLLGVLHRLSRHVTGRLAARRDLA